VGGTPQNLVPGDVGAANPVWSPDGKWILFATGVYRIEDWAIVPSDLAEPVTHEQFESAQTAGQPGPVAILKLDTLKKSGLGDPTPCQWPAGNRLLFSAKSGDTSHVFEIGLSPPGMMAKQWRLDSSPRRLTFGTSFDQGASLASAAAGSAARRMAFASLTRKENLWGLPLDTDHPRPGGRPQQLTRESGFHIFPSISRDGTKLAFISHTAYNDEVWLLDLKTGKRSLLSTTVSAKWKSHITPDGSQVFYGDAGGLAAGIAANRVYAVSASGGAPTPLCEQCNGWVWDWSPDRRRLLTYGQTKTSVVATLQNLETGKASVYLECSSAGLVEFLWSPDGRWVCFATSNDQGPRRVYVAPFTGDQGPAENTWIPITDGSALECHLSWSPGGDWVYSHSDRDGFLCIWAYPLDPRTKKPAGAPLAVFHSHGARLSLRNANLVSQGLSVARDKIVFNQGEITGNIWMAEWKER
jgi:WD40 repeat protein